ncbi:MAG: hypothetical protein IKQ77_00585 [Prevotella sp.]|nr:hypothetical protein [Prevotella sp.]
MVVMRVKRPATKEEMELFICLGNRLQVFKTVKVITKNGEEDYYKNINAVVTLAFFVSYLCKEEYEADKVAFLNEMDNLSEDALMDKIIDMALDYFEDYAKKRNNQFLISLVNSNKEILKTIKRCPWYELKNYPTLPSTAIEWDFNQRDME